MGQNQNLEDVEQGNVDYVFLAPEQSRKPETIERVQTARPTLFVVDEAHCISEWGHDFRNDYLRLGHAIDALHHPLILAPQMREYAETSTCRRELLLAYLGDAFQGPCGRCDNCERAAGPVEVDPDAGTRREVV